MAALYQPGRRDQGVGVMRMVLCTVMRPHHRSPASTTHWDDLPMAPAGPTRLAVWPGAFSAVYNIPRSARDTACVPPMTR
ncbi:MAG: DUF4113 domain-containing protein [Candidatus Competibacteraceae bacterium]|nr:DUF4113 domain-containing protein [Candidatus Competibacteraceae bacterium]